MSYLVDTNVISELRRREPDPGVVAWFSDRPATTLYLSVLTLGEIRKGIESLPNGKKRLVLRDWVQARFGDATPVIVKSATEFAAIVAGNPIAPPAPEHSRFLVAFAMERECLRGLESLRPLLRRPARRRRRR